MSNNTMTNKRNEMTFINSGDIFMVKPSLSYRAHAKLPSGTYTIGFSREEGYFFKVADGFELPSKIYGDSQKDCDRIINTFKSRPYTTGVLLSGEKGSGKSLLAKLIASTCSSKLEIPVIIVNTPLCGEQFNIFISSITQPIVLVFDEFEKVYSEQESQESLLTLLDGTYQSKKLCVFTCNDSYRINSHMRNRPGRIFYAIEYKGLDLEFVKDYCRHNLNNKDFIRKVCNISERYRPFNFDMLQALVEESNRYEEDPTKSIKYLNMKENDEDYFASKRYETFVTAVTPNGQQNMFKSFGVQDPLNGLEPIRGYFAGDIINDTYGSGEYAHKTAMLLSDPNKMEAIRGFEMSDYFHDHIFDYMIGIPNLSPDNKEKEPLLRPTPQISVSIDELLRVKNNKEPNDGEVTAEVPINNNKKKKMAMPSPVQVTKDSFRAALGPNYNGRNIQFVSASIRYHNTHIKMADSYTNKFVIEGAELILIGIDLSLNGEGGGEFRFCIPNVRIEAKVDYSHFNRQRAMTEYDYL